MAAGRVLLVRLDDEARAEAAFLDQRALASGTEGYWLPLDTVLAHPLASDVARVDWIFHVGHCGSTLLSRLLQAWPGLQVLREPQPLRTLAAMMETSNPGRADALLDRLVALWARPLSAGARSLIKASSSCNALRAPARAVPA